MIQAYILQSIQNIMLYEQDAEVSWSVVLTEKWEAAMFFPTEQEITDVRRMFS